MREKSARIRRTRRSRSPPLDAAFAVIARDALRPVTVLTSDSGDLTLPCGPDAEVIKASRSEAVPLPADQICHCTSSRASTPRGDMLSPTRRQAGRAQSLDEASEVEPAGRMQSCHLRKHTL
ncbi:hypothetical protein GCM10010269_64260 [Streptomyces humidus]|uniref:Uncharacterized protein n=1 Tax=Streptomyces humidus TaxID=52259 RepID=A0A918G2J0_9ACTN|nr:hypothetical protein GCM10010269_64260 [Streptomyces humidus]